jgi:hypothetical protein
VRRHARAAFAVQQALSVLPPDEGMAKMSDVKPSFSDMVRAGTTGFAGRRDWLRPGALGNPRIGVVALTVVVAIGLLTWGLVSGPSDAESRSASAAPAVLPVAAAQTPSSLDPPVTPTNAVLAGPSEENAAPPDGLQISSQFWRRGGLGSNALVTFTLRNRNDYAVKDIEISCAFSREDGSHLTDRTRTIHDTVSMKSRKTFARLHVGFVNINASKAKCALVAASRI